MSLGVNPVSDMVMPELSVQSETVNYYREAPPPYSASVSSPVVTSQPIIHQTIIVPPTLANGPTFYNCPRCNERVLTNVKYVNSTKTHLLAGFICGLTCWCLLCCLAVIPYLGNTFKSSEHYCPNCKLFLGNFSKW